MCLITNITRGRVFQSFATGKYFKEVQRQTFRTTVLLIWATTSFENIYAVPSDVSELKCSAFDTYLLHKMKSNLTQQLFSLNLQSIILSLLVLRVTSLQNYVLQNDLHLAKRAKRYHTFFGFCNERRIGPKLLIRSITLQGWLR